MLGYSNACLELAVKIPEAGKLHGINTLVIPSRGAIPFFLGMTYSLNKLKEFGGVQEDFYTNLHVQKIIRLLMNKNIQEDLEMKDGGIGVLVVPFTADLNVTKFDKDLDNGEYTLKTRKYWANVTRAFFKNKKERRRDPYFKTFVEVILRNIEGREDMAKSYENFQKIDSFSLMDTVISGRASNHILQAFDKISKEENNDLMRPYSFLILDENGNKLRTDFKSYLMRKKVEGELEMYPIPRIVSEDEGASLLGVAAIIYPSVMRASKRCEINGKEFFVGAGSWYGASELNKDYTKNFRKFMRLVYKGVDLIYSKDYLGRKGIKEKERFNQTREDYLSYCKEKEVLSKYDQNISLLKLSDKHLPEKVYETSSHVVHIPFDKESNERILSEINKSKNNSI